MRLLIFITLFFAVALPATAQDTAGTIATATSDQQNAAIATRRQAEDPHSPRETTVVEAVSASEDTALDKIVDAERLEETTEDLLREDSLKE